MTLLVDYSAEHVRTALRAYFTVLTLFIGFVGSYCCGLRAQLSVVRHGEASLSHMTGWLKGLDLVNFGYKLRSVPGGWMGFLMLIVTALSLSSDLAVAGLVTGVQVPRRCLFGQGLVLDENSGSQVYPSPNGAPVFVATQAQATSLNNTGLEGIYRKLNNATNFRADEHDYMGSWSCADQGTTTYNVSNTASDIVASLQEQGLLYEGTNLGGSVNGPAGNQMDSAGQFTHLVMVSSSLGDSGKGQPFEIRASIDLEEDTNVPVTMWSFHCTMNASEAEYILSNMGSQATLVSWGLYFQGSMYNGAGTSAWPNSGEILARILNTMTMVAGGMNSLQRQPGGTDENDLTQGCLAPRTSISIAVVAMVLAMGGIAVFVCSLTMFFQVRIIFARRSHNISEDAQKQISCAPNGLVDWMIQAVRETPTGGGVESSMIKTWRFGRDGTGYGLFRPGGPSTGVPYPGSNSSIELRQRMMVYSRVQDNEN